MARYHINNNGDAGTCRAASGKCPFGGDADHYDTAEEARAAFERQMGGGFAPAPTAPLSAASYDVPADLREAAQRVLNRYKVDALGQWTTEAYSRKDWDAFTDLSAEETAEWNAAEERATAVLVPQVDFGAVMGSPCKLTRKETNALRKGLQEYDLTEEEFNSFLASDNASLFGGRGGQLHPSRLQKVSLQRNYTNDFATAAYVLKDDYRAAEQARVAAAEDPHGTAARNLAEKEKAREAFYGKAAASAVSKRREHFHGAWFGKKAAEAASGGGSRSSSPKELDPAMIEALKLKYLKKFKQPFDESGLSVGELLQMAQQGLLD